MKSGVQFKLLTTGSALGIAMAGFGGAANAQDAPNVAEDDAGAFPAIVVTARKREETLLEVPLAITAFSQEALEDRGITSVADISAYTPGFDFQEVGQGGASGRDNPNIRFRGVAVQNENPASRAGAIFWEGTYLSAGAGLLPTFDLQRVEVIKGPQNAFFGRNTFAGAVDFIPAEPGDVLEGFVNGLYSPSDQDTYELTGAISVPIGEGFGARLAAQYRRAGADFTYRNGDPLGEEETLSLQGTLLYDMGGLRLKTTGFWVDGEDTRAITSIDYTTEPGECDLVYSGNLYDLATKQVGEAFSTDLSTINRGTFCGELPDWDDAGFNVPIVGEFSALQPGDVQFDNLFPILSTFDGSLLEYNLTLPSEMQGFMIPDPQDGLGNTYRVWRINQSAEIEVMNGHTLSALGSYAKSGSFRTSDQIYGQGNQLRLTSFAFYSRDTYGQIRFASPAEQRLRYQIGFSYFDSISRTAQYSSFAGVGGTQDDNPLTFLDSKAYGIFGSVDFDITPALTLSLEGRYGWDELVTVYNGPSQDLLNPLDYLADPDPDTPGNQADPADFNIDNVAVRGAKQSFNKFMPRVLLSYSPDRNLNVYGSWAISYLQGSDTNVTDYVRDVPDAAVLADTLGLFTPVQKLTAYEIGIKAQPMRNLGFSIAGYYMDWKNQVQFELSPFPIFTPLFQSGDSEYKGVEAELTFEPVPGLRFDANVNWVDAEFKDFAGTGSVTTQILNPELPAATAISSIGLRPRYIPEWSGSVGMQLGFGEIGASGRETFLRIDGTYFGSFFEDNFEYNEIPGSWKWNARLALGLTENVRFDVYALNILDDLSFTPSGGTTSGNAFTTAENGTFSTRKAFGTLPRAREIGVQLRFDF